MDAVVANRQTLSPAVLRRYRAKGAGPVIIDRDAVLKLKVRLVTGNLAEEHGVLRHNSSRLARLLVDTFLLPS
jgi:hypothetical protein